MTIPIGESVNTKVRAKVITTERPPDHPTLEKTIAITSKQSYSYVRRAGIISYQLQQFHCQRNGAVPIVSLHNFYFQIPKNYPGQWHHECSNAQSQAVATHHSSVTVHHPPRCCHNPSLVEIRMLHNPRPVQIRTFPNTKRLLLR